MMREAETVNKEEKSNDSPLKEAEFSEEEQEKVAGNGKASKKESSEGRFDEDFEDEECSDESTGKRKNEIPEQSSSPDAKKLKTENEGFRLYVGNLDTSKTHEETRDALRKFFSQHNISHQDIRICSSKRFGYVYFSSEEELEKALALNNMQVLGQPLSLAKAYSKEVREEFKKARESRTLFVKNLAHSTTPESLRVVFENAVDIRVPVMNNGANKGIAYIEFETEADADEAMDEKQGAEVDGRAVIVDFTGKKSRKGSIPTYPPDADSRTLLVNNLSYRATQEALQEMFEKATFIRLPQNKLGRAKGYAFVEFGTVEDAQEALENCNNKEIAGRQVRLEFSRPEGQRSKRGPIGPTKILMVRGLSQETTEDSLKKAFDGAIAGRLVINRLTGECKGFGFVEFNTEEEAKTALETMQDGEVDGSKVVLEFAKPKSRNWRDWGRKGGRGGGGGKGGFQRSKSSRGFGGRGGF
ncbi:nucleolin isoform X2 [Latimeria chalumnae]|uniref:Nucleolin n=1 Tax=Latimeria chalumnae TaxID=7897 RepID=M3XKV3_LATCH|nr:PREDICTED: nucleolin-like isoform X2 [Latimeria chalumnae]|eukprot:XP_005997412.1 PREDICTED: nucleolin-like isoform X2 [Latimeria chalumnae]